MKHTRNTLFLCYFANFATVQYLTESDRYLQYEAWREICFVDTINQIQADDAKCC